MEIGQENNKRERKRVLAERKERCVNFKCRRPRIEGGTQTTRVVQGETENLFLGRFGEGGNLDRTPYQVRNKTARKQRKGRGVKPDKKCLPQERESVKKMAEKKTLLRPHTKHHLPGQRCPPVVNATGRGGKGNKSVLWRTPKRRGVRGRKPLPR